MNPFNLPSDTEYAYSHLFQPHPWLFVTGGLMRPPINPKVPVETQFTLAELAVRDDRMPTLPSATAIKQRRRR